MIKALIKALFFLILLIFAAAAGLFWLPTGPLLLSLAQRFGEGMTPSIRIDAVEGSLRQGYEVRGVAVASGDETYLTLDRAAVSPDWALILAGTPWLRSIEVQGLSTDVPHLQALAAHFGGGESEEEEQEPSGPIAILPLRASIRDVHLGLTDGKNGRNENLPKALDLAELLLNEEGGLSLRARAGDLPLEADARLAFDPLEILSSDLRLGKGTLSARGRPLPPLDLRGDLSALPIETLLAFVPDSPVQATGRLDGRFHVDGGGEARPLTASGVLSVPRSVVMDVPLSCRLPWGWDGRVFSVEGAELRTRAAVVGLTASADLGAGAEGLRVAARGDVRNLSLREIGKIAAPGAGLTGEGGRVSFDLRAALERGIPAVAGDFTARLPEVSLDGRRIVKGLAADLRLAPGEDPRLSCSGEVFGGKLFGRAEVSDPMSGGAVRPRAILSLVNMDLAAIAAAFPAAFAGSGVHPAGRVGLRLQIEEDLSVRGNLTSEQLSAAGFTVRDLAADLGYDYGSGRAALDSLTGRLAAAPARRAAKGGGAPFSASGTANVKAQTLDIRANIRNLDPASIPQLKDSQFKGLCDLEAAVDGTFSAPRVSARLRGRNNSVADVPLGNLDVSVNYAGDRVTIPETRISLPGGTVALRGNAVLGGGEPRLDLAASTAGLDLAKAARALKLKDPLSGTVQGRVSVRGPLSSAAVTANLRADKVRAGEIQIPYAVLEAGGNMRRVDVGKLEAKVGDALVKGRGRVTMDRRSLMDSALDIGLSVRKLAIKPLLRRFMDRPPVGGILNGDLNLKGTLAKPTLALKLGSPLLVGQMLVDAVTLDVSAPSKDRYALSATGRIGDFDLALDGEVRRARKGWAWTVVSKPVDIAKLVAVTSPGMKGMLSGQATARAKGAAPGDGPIDVQISVPKLTAIDKVVVKDISLPLTVRLNENRVRMKEGRAVLSDGVIRAAMDIDLAQSNWKGNVRVRGLDMGKLAAPFLPEGELVGSADMDVDMKGSFGGVFSMAFADGRFSSSSGYLHKMGMIEKISPTKRIGFENIRGTFFWDGTDLFINPGTQVTAGPGEPLYRYFSINGSMGLPGKGLKLLCKGRFDLKLLDQVLGAMKGLFQYMTGGLMGSGGMLRDSVGRALGVKSRDFQDVSFTLANSWQELRLLNLKIDKPIQDFLPIDMLNNEEKQKDNKQFRLKLRFPTGPGATDAEDESTEDQLKRQILDNLFNIGG